ncbi:hypothetical protein HAHE_17130 [Haloferula helveola]|uniref:Lipoprotein SmpA/OmlA domain-containing protein n=1 Tax=Haloferula helveola TaxID=490095 RepID=A0ABM7R9A7_9BACT|nr:hypothetical protein HAHE_17130 [Haloferula helveola]
MKRAAIALLILALGFAGGWMARSLAAPDYPSHWDSVKLGMTASEAKGMVPDLDPWLREVKGFDQAGIDLGDRYWSLLVRYDEKGRVSEITKNYVDRRIGIFNRSLVESKP